MSDVGLLFDEHVARSLQEQLHQAEPQLRLFAVGDGIAPPLGTPDPGLLRWLEEHNCLLVTNNRSSMPGHLADHLAAGKTRSRDHPIAAPATVWPYTLRPQLDCHRRRSR